MNDTKLVPDPKRLAILEKATVIDQKISISRGWPLLGLALRRQFLTYYWLKPPSWRVLLRARNTNRMTPTFLSLGPVRSGTTSLSDYIMQHPSVVLPLAKEIGISVAPTLRMLEAQFPTMAEQRQVEEQTGKAITGYCTPVIPNLMFTRLLNAFSSMDLRFVIILRNPVERTFAHWRFERMLLKPVENDPMWKGLPGFSEIVEMEIEAAAYGAASGATHYSGANVGGYIQNSIYAPFIKNLLRDRPLEKMLIIKSEDFFADSVGIAKRVYGFLELPEFEPALLSVKNAAPPGDMDPDTRKKLVDFFEPLNRELYELTGQDFNWS